MRLASERVGRAKGIGAANPVVANASFPLHEAALEGRPETVRSLLERGYSASSLDHMGRTPSDCARAGGYHDLANELEDRASGRSPDEAPRVSGLARLSIKELFGLVQGKPEVVTELIAARRLDAVDGKGDTPLHICAAQGRLQFCDRLIRAGADPSSLNFEHKRPHERAAENGHLTVAGLLASLLPGVAGSDLQPGQEPAEKDAFQSESSPLEKEQETEPLDFDDFDLDFDGEEEAEDFHRDIERNVYFATFEAVEDRVTRLGEDDGADIAFDDLPDTRLDIEADDIDRVSSRSAQVAENATYRSFVDVRHGRYAAHRAKFPSTKYHTIPDEALREWTTTAVVNEGCTEEDVDVLISHIRGSFDAEVVRANLVRELERVGLMPSGDETAGEVCLASEIRDADDIADLLASICNGSNMRPGMEYKPVSAKYEKRMFESLDAARHEIVHTLVSDGMLLSVVLMLGERVERGTVDPRILTELDMRKDVQTAEGDLLSAALSYLSGYQTLLEEDDVTPEDHAHAVEAVLTLRLSRLAVELIVRGVEDCPELDGVRQRVERALEVSERSRQEILLAHLSLVRRLAARRSVHVDEVEDLVQEGVFGLIRSIELFNPDFGNRFLSYCQYRIRQAIGRAQDESGCLVRVPAHHAVILRRIDRIEDEMAESMPAEAAIAYIAEEIGLPCDTVRRARRVPRRPVPFEEMAPELPDLDTPQFRARLAEQRAEVLEEFLSDMPERAADIIVRRFGLRGEDEMTLEELGAIYGVTRERIRQIEAKQMAALSHPAHRRLLRALL